MRLVFFGSGPFGLPTLESLMRQHQIELVISQPDRPAGRNRKPQPTPITRFAEDNQLAIVRPEDVNDDKVIESIRGVEADAFVIIAFGQKLSRPLLENIFAINLHASLLPKFRGAAPINWAVIHNETHTGISVITLADRMDAGAILGRASTPIDPQETAGELHDRLAEMGPELVEQVLGEFEAGTLVRKTQDESLATKAPKMSKSLGNYIGITDAPGEMFGKLMSISDDLMWRYFEVLSFRSLDDINALKKSVADGMNPRDAKFELGQEIVARFHSEAEATGARQEFISRFQQGSMPEEIPEVTLESQDGKLGIFLI